MTRSLWKWRVAAFMAMLAGVAVGPQLPHEIVLLMPPVLIAGFVMGYVSAIRETG